MKIVFDTNVIIDVVARREGFVANSAAVMKMAEQKIFTAAMTANTVTDVYYILQKYLVECARQWDAERIVTRNTGDFLNSPIKAVTPEEFLEFIA